jgi:hypothetical protein
MTQRTIFKATYKMPREFSPTEAAVCSLLIPLA